MGPVSQLPRECKPLTLALETFVKIVYSLVWAVLTLQPISKRVYQCATPFPMPPRRHDLLPLTLPRCHRFPPSLPYVIIDVGEQLYIAGFALLQVFVIVFPVFTSSKEAGGGESGTMAFLPLMLTSVYCAVGLVWAFLRLSYIYLRGL